MKHTIGIALFAIWVLIASSFTTDLWLTRPDLFPRIPPSFAENAVRLYGAENAEQVSDLEMLIGFAISIPLVTLVTFVAMRLVRRFRTD